MGGARLGSRTQFLARRVWVSGPSRQQRQRVRWEGSTFWSVVCVRWGPWQEAVMPGVNGWLGTWSWSTPLGGGPPCRWKATGSGLDGGAHAG